MNDYPGILIAIDGIDGAGKTTQVRGLADALVGVGENVVISKEPTDGQWGQKLRDSAFSGRMPFDEELNAFILDRQDHLKTKIIPALITGAIVILDRYFYSTIAYQGILVDDYKTIEPDIRANVVVPDVAFWLDLPADLGASRVRSRDGKLNNFEKQEDLFKAGEVFRAIFDGGDQTLARIDATMSIHLIHKEIIDHLVSGALKAKRCAKAYGCDEPIYCTARHTNTCDWFRLQAGLLLSTAL